MREVTVMIEYSYTSGGMIYGLGERFESLDG